MQTPARTQQLSVSFFTIVFLIQLIKYELQYLLSYSHNSGIKKQLLFMSNFYQRNILQLLPHLTPGSQQTLNQQLAMGEEKKRAIGAILNNLAKLDEPSVLQAEEYFETLLKQNTNDQD